MAATDYEIVSDVSGDEAARVGTLVMKFGGTSVGDPERLRRSPRGSSPPRSRAAASSPCSPRWAHTTDELIELAHRISDRPKPRAMDMLISVGERISCALAEMAIEDLGHEAISLTGSQAGIVTDTTHTKAKIVEVRAQRIHSALDEGKIVLVAGFQGVSTVHEITTLGRGGSDTTAVALAAALGADSCEIFTDVEGVYTADPRIVPAARQAADGHLRGDARDVGLGGEGDGATLRRVRPQPRRAPARAVDVQRVRRARGSRRRTRRCWRRRSSRASRTTRPRRR